MNPPAYVLDTDLPPIPGSSHAEPSLQEGAIRYLCSICRKGYAQRQGAWRHIRTVHHPNLCLYCKFTWARPYEYKNHLKKKHPGVNPDVTPGKAPSSLCWATVLTERLRQQPPVSPPTVGQGQRNWAGSQPYPSALPSPSLSRARDTGAFPRAVSFVHYNLQRVYAEQTVTMDEREYTHGSEVLDATYHHAILLSTPNDLYISPRDGQFGLPSAYPGTAHSPSNAETAPIPTLSPPVVENYGTIVSGDPVVETYRPMRYSPTEGTHSQGFP